MRRSRWRINLLYTMHEKLMFVYDKEGHWRPAEFASKVAAREAQCIISRLITASTFRGSTLTKVRLP